MLQWVSQVIEDIKMWYEHQRQTWLPLVCHFFLRLPHFDVICDLLINRRMTTLQH